MVSGHELEVFCTACPFMWLAELRSRGSDKLTLTMAVSESNKLTQLESGEGGCTQETSW